MITLSEYFMGRDRSHPEDCTDEIRGNAALTVARVNLLLAEAEEELVAPGIDEVTSTHVASGWRPRGINARTQNAAVDSNHLTARACDLQDTPERKFARWCLRNLGVLERIGLWMEDPQWTPSWVHLQTVPPGSGRRVYRPSAAEALVAKLPEQLEPLAATQAGFGMVHAIAAVAMVGALTALALMAKNFIEGVREDGVDAGRRAALLEVAQRDNTQLAAVQKRVLELQAELAEREQRHQAEVARIDQEGTDELRKVEKERDAARRRSAQYAGRLRDPGAREAPACPAGGDGGAAPAVVAGAGVDPGAARAPGGEFSAEAGGFLRAEADRADEVAHEHNALAVRLEACQEIAVDDRRN
jgi:hypothetical protein